jgi:FixJ family two-component response regulator
LEDDGAVAKVIGIIAESCGMEVRILTESPQFFDTVDKWNPTHIALDLMMPGRGGSHILAELARRQSQSQIIIMSGASDRVLHAAGDGASQRGLNIAAVLAKPFSTAALRGALSGGALFACESAAHPISVAIERELGFAD